MKNKNFDLEHCINYVEDNSSKGLMSPDAEIYAVNHLRERPDILKFHRAYVDCMKEAIGRDVENDKKQSHAVELVKRGYPIQKVAAFFVHDGLMFTLGHIYNQQALEAWYSVLPYMKKGFPKEMYQR